MKLQGTRRAPGAAHGMRSALSKRPPGLAASPPTLWAHLRFHPVLTPRSRNPDALSAKVRVKFKTTAEEGQSDFSILQRKFTLPSVDFKYSVF